MTMATVKTTEEDFHRHLEVLLQQAQVLTTSRCGGRETTEADLVDGNATQ